MNAPIIPSQLTVNLGGKWHQSYGVAPCPVCQPDRRKDQNALTISAHSETLLLHCKKIGCDFKDILCAAGYATGTPQVDQAALALMAHDRTVQAAKKLERARSIWIHGVDIIGTKGEVYLRGRGITCHLPASLRWLSDAYHAPSGHYCAAIVADVTPMGGVHRTFFTKQGKRLANSAKLMLGPCSGGAVHLSQGYGCLVVCEGIETGLSLLSGLLEGSHSVWAALSTSGLRTVELPKKNGSLIIATDGDEAGAEAGNALAHRAHALGWDVSLMAAPDGQDWNDVLQSGMAA